MILVVHAHDGGVLIALARLLQQAHGPAPVDDLERQLDLRERKGSAGPMVLALDRLGGDVLDLGLVP
jgi:hypothetical protein